MLGTISVQKPIKGYPMIDSIQVADSKWNASSTGNVNFYLQKNDPIYANIKKKNEVSALFSNETTQVNNETSQVEKVGHRVLITGFVAQVNEFKILDAICRKTNTALSLRRFRPIQPFSMTPLMLWSIAIRTQLQSWPD